MLVHIDYNIHSNERCITSQILFTKMGLSSPTSVNFNNIRVFEVDSKRGFCVCQIDNYTEFENWKRNWSEYCTINVSQVKEINIHDYINEGKEATIDQSKWCSPYIP